MKLFNNLQRISILVSILLIASTSVILARDPMPDGVTNYKQQVFEPALASQDVNLQSTVYEIYLSMVSSMNRSLFCYEQNCLKVQPPTAPGTTPPPTGVPVVDTGSQTQYAQATGLIPDIFNLNTGLITSQPVSATEYVADIGNNLNLGVQPAYAQGIGYEGLRPVLNIWQAFRNIAYLFATVGFIVLAFLVMFRIKISSQAVITAQSAIIKFIVVVLAITFSYAIAGFIVDLIYLFSGAIIWLFINTGLINTGFTDIQTLLFSGSIMKTLGALISTTQPAGENIQNIATNLFATITSSSLDNLISRLFGHITGEIGQLIISIAIVYSLFRLLVQLLFAYLEILLLTILSPILIIPDILPGGNAFLNWMRSLFANAMIFPATVFMLLVGIVVVGGDEATAFGVSQGISMGGGLTLPFLSFTSDMLAQLLGIGFILVTPKVNDMVKNALKASSFGYMSAIGQAVGVGAAGAGAIGGTITSPFGKIGGGAMRFAGNEYLAKEESKARTAGKGRQRALIRSAREQFFGGRR